MVKPYGCGMELRYYQLAAIDACYRYLRESMGNPCIVLPTGSGKTPVIATLVRDAVLQWDGRVLILAHVKELLEQTAEKLHAICPMVTFGVYSAGLKRRDTKQKVIVGGIQSVYDKADQLGHFDLIIIDEAHLIPHEGEGRYRTLIADLREINPDIRIIGLTATPYRLGTGWLCGEENILTEVCYEVGVKELISQGYLSPIVGKNAAARIDSTSLKVVRGEYLDSQAELAFLETVKLACAEILDRTVTRKSVLLFCQGVEHARTVAAILRADLVGRDALTLAQLDPARSTFEFGDDPLSQWELGVWADWLEENGSPVDRVRVFMARGRAIVGEIYGDTPAEERAELIRQFRERTLRYLVNVNVLTTGFDATNVDCVGLLRATASPGLYYQMVGRGFRLSPGKYDTLLLDFGENIVRHGPVDMVRPKFKGESSDKPQGKECPECGTVVGIAMRACPDCGFVWTAPEPAERKAPHSHGAGDEDPLSGKTTEETHEVIRVEYHPHTKKGADETAPRTLRVVYKTSMTDSISEWICVEHSGWAGDRARQWWDRRCDYPMPADALDAAIVGRSGLLAEPKSIVVQTKHGEKFPRIVKYDLGPVPTHPTPCGDCGAINRWAIVENDEPRFPGQIRCGDCNRFIGYATAEMCERYGVLPHCEWKPMLPYQFPEYHNEPQPVVTGESSDDDIPF
jgi:DNA repair protein RadD